MEMDQNSNVINIERSFDVPVDTLFKAWTEAEHLKKWWHPMGESITDVKNDLKEGGEVAYYVGEAGLEITGNYSEVIPNEKLVYSWIWNMSDEGSESGYKLHITFSAEGEGSKLQVMQEGFSGPELLKPHQDGWENGLNDLSAYLNSGSTNGSGHAGSDNTNASGNGNAESGTSSGSTSQSSSTGQPTQDNLKSDENMSDRSGGYNEAPEQVKVGGG